MRIAVLADTHGNLLALEAVLSDLRATEEPNRTRLMNRWREVFRRTRGLWGAASEVSRGKDTPSGHWEIAGVPVPWDWTYFPDADPAFVAYRHGIWGLLHDEVERAQRAGHRKIQPDGTERAA